METVSNIIEEVKEQICNDYCRYPQEYEDSTVELSESEYCQNCPLNRL